jgi:NitT/TauT family transport system permease protein
MNIITIAKRFALVLTPALVLLGFWEFLTSQNQRAAFLFGQPTTVVHIFLKRFMDGSLFTDIQATLLPMLAGFIIGNLLGIALGLLLWRFQKINQIARPYLIALGAVPAFIFAPVLVVWFGTGIEMKIVLVFLSTVLVAAFQATTGASEIDADFFHLFRTFRANDAAIFRHLVLPSAAAWVFAGLRLNIGFALLGEFVGEFISSENGVAHRALVDAGLYNLSAVWVSAFVIAALAILLYTFIVRLEAIFVPWKAKFLSRGIESAD